MKCTKYAVAVLVLLLACANADACFRGFGFRGYCAPCYPACYQPTCYQPCYSYCPTYYEANVIVAPPTYLTFDSYQYAFPSVPTVNIDVLQTPAAVAPAPPIAPSQGQMQGQMPGSVPQVALAGTVSRSRAGKP